MVYNTNFKLQSLIARVIIVLMVFSCFQNHLFLLYAHIMASHIGLSRDGHKKVLRLYEVIMTNNKITLQHVYVITLK